MKNKIVNIFKDWWYDSYYDDFLVYIKKHNIWRETGKHITIWISIISYITYLEFYLNKWPIDDVIINMVKIFTILLSILMIFYPVIWIFIFTIIVPKVIWSFTITTFIAIFSYVIALAQNNWIYSANEFIFTNLLILPIFANIMYHLIRRVSIFQGNENTFAVWVLSILAWSIPWYITFWMINSITW